MKAVVAAFNQEKALVGAFSVITNLRMELFEALVSSIVFLVTSLMLLISRVMDTIILESRWSGVGEFPFCEIR